LIDQQNRQFDFVRYESEGGPQQPGLFQAVGISPGHIRVTKAYENIAELKVYRLVERRPDVFWHGVVSEKLQGTILPQMGPVVESLAGKAKSDRDIELHYFYSRWVESLIRLLLRIRDYGHGGAVLISPTIPDNSLNVKHEIDYDRLASALPAAAQHSMSEGKASDAIHAQAELGVVPTDLYYGPLLSKLDRSHFRGVVGA
jgi:hypothetical protein